MKEKLKTFKEWSSEGYTINKGSKATWINNVPKFSRSQVSKRFHNTRYSVWENYDPRFENGSQSDVYGEGNEDWISDLDFGNN